MLSQSVYSRIAHIDGHCLWQSYIRKPGNQPAFCYKVDGNTYQILVRRFLWEEANGVVPAGCSIVNTCGIGACVCPEHSEAMTLRERTIFQDRTPMSEHIKTTHCPRGHAYEVAGSIYTNRKGQKSRFCRVCKTEKSRERRRAEKEGNQVLSEEDQKTR